MEGQVTYQLIVFVIDTHLLLGVVTYLLIVQVVFSSSDFTQSAGGDALLARTTGLTIDGRLFSAKISKGHLVVHHVVICEGCILNEREMLLSDNPGEKSSLWNLLEECFQKVRVSFAQHHYL